MGSSLLYDVDIWPPQSGKSNTVAQWVYGYLKCDQRMAGLGELHAVLNIRCPQGFTLRRASLSGVQE